MENRASQTENGIGTLMMYLYQSYTMDLGMTSKEAKEAVEKVVNQELNKFLGTKNNKNIDKTKEDFLKNEIKECFVGLRSQLKTTNQPEYWLNKMKTHLKKILEKE